MVNLTRNYPANRPSHPHTWRTNGVKDALSPITEICALVSFYRINPMLDIPQVTRQVARICFKTRGRVWKDPCWAGRKGGYEALGRDCHSNYAKQNDGDIFPRKNYLTGERGLSSPRDLTRPPLHHSSSLCSGALLWTVSPLPPALHLPQNLHLPDRPAVGKS